MHFLGSLSDWIISYFASISIVMLKSSALNFLIFHFSYRMCLYDNVVISNLNIYLIFSINCNCFNSCNLLSIHYSFTLQVLALHFGCPNSSMYWISVFSWLFLHTSMSFILDPSLSLYSLFSYLLGSCSVSRISSHRLKTHFLLGFSFLLLFLLPFLCSQDCSYYPHFSNFAGFEAFVYFITRFF